MFKKKNIRENTKTHTTIPKPRNNSLILSIVYKIHYCVHCTTIKSKNNCVQIWLLGRLISGISPSFSDLSVIIASHLSIQNK